MINDKKLLRLSLQFFGEGDDVDADDPDNGDSGDAYDDFEEEFFGIDDDLDEGADGDAEDGADDGADGDADDDADGGADSDADDDADDGADSDADEGADGDADDSADDGADNGAQGANDDAQSANGDLISELRALGYVGNDLAALTADMKAKREAKAAQEAKEQAKADRADGKAHVRSSVPGRSGSGDGTGGINERQVERFVSITNASKETARQRLSKHARLIEGK